MNKYIIIPARLESVRLPGKLLLRKGESTVLDHAISIACSFAPRWNVILATDNDQLEDIGRQWDITVVRTSAAHQNGTSRILEAADRLGISQEDIIVNLQGDVVDLDPTALEFCLNPPLNTFCSAYTNVDLPKCEPVSFVKVVTDEFGYAMYFSRYPIPFNRTKKKVHVGIYGFHYNTLVGASNKVMRGCAECENLEQLMWLENGYPIKMREIKYATSIDIKEDYNAWINSKS